jgi:hypothetical protein
MAPERSVQQKIALGIGLGLSFGAMLWLVSLILAAGHINSESKIVFELRFGPFWLTTLSRNEIASGGAIASVSLHSGLLWLLLSCAGLGGVINAFRIRFTGGKPGDRHQ